MPMEAVAGQSKDCEFGSQNCILGHEHVCMGRPQAFPSVRARGRMQAAAKALGVNQSTVQRRIAELEKCLGHRLVKRHLGGYRLTELGDELLPAAEGVEAAVAALERHLAACDKGLSGTVRVTCGSSLAACLRQTPLIDAFHSRHPGLRVELVISERYVDLSKGEADIAIRLGEPRDEAPRWTEDR
jgi:DNA-binding transcriptional LysR family regulator